MAKVSYAKLGLKVNSNVNTFTFENETIEVLKYLPIKDKYDLIMITLQRAEEEGIYNGVLLDAYFHLYLVYMYSNLSFTDKQKENELKLYDTLESSGFLDKFLAAMDKREYDELYNYLNQIKNEKTNYDNTFASYLKTLVETLPKSAEEAKKIVDSFDKEKYQDLMTFAKAANGGRPIKQ